ncbi:hypothetical protein KP509_12G083000 [Ceratopteris richardii]|uniref:Exocyst subunit Exo70 family protein n=1 Tax=Ceratopteris richardii TaxID=49495 RepID=A0A8T2TNA1_CERRI|nr:hypothetical protein KP509_12G083000 [Ceratopteris richardii]
MANNDGDKRVLATAQHIEPRGPPASSVSAIIQKMGERLNVAEEAIMRRSSDVRLIWDGHPDDAVIYLRAVDDLQSLMGPLSSPWSDKAMLHRAHHEFNVMVVTNSESVDTEWLSYCENEPSTHSGRGGEDLHAPVSDSSDDDEDEDIPLAHPDIPLAHPVTDFNAVFDPIPPKRIVGYGRECIQVYVSILGMQKIKMEIVQKRAWEGLEVKIKNWMQALKVAAKVVFPTEKKLCDNVFVGLNPQRENSFPELASGALMQFLAFGKAIAGVRRTPEKLFKILDMFEITKDLRSDINMVFCDEICERIRTEVGIVLGQLGEAAWGTLQEFELAIQKDASKILVVGGAFHPLTRYVMNYIQFLVDYSATLEIFLKDKRREVPKSLGVETFGLSKTLLESRSQDSEQVSSLAVQIMWLIVYLEGNLDAKSKLYMDQSMALLFLMNNVHYIVQKHNGQDRVCAANYVRTTWKTVFSCLRDEGLTTNGRLSSGVSRVAIKDRFKNFNLAFEEACASQSSFVVPDPQLREELMDGGKYQRSAGCGHFRTQKEIASQPRGVS